MAIFVSSREIQSSVPLIDLGVEETPQLAAARAEICTDLIEQLHSGGGAPALIAVNAEGRLLHRSLFTVAAEMPDAHAIAGARQMLAQLDGGVAAAGLVRPHGTAIGHVVLWNQDAEDCWYVHPRSDGDGGFEWMVFHAEEPDDEQLWAGDSEIAGVDPELLARARQLAGAGDTAEPGPDLAGPPLPVEGTFAEEEESDLDHLMRDAVGQLQAAAQAVSSQTEIPNEVMYDRDAEIWGHSRLPLVIEGSLARNVEALVRSLHSMRQTSRLTASRFQHDGWIYVLGLQFDGDRYDARLMRAQLGEQGLHRLDQIDPGPYLPAAL